MKAIRTTLLAVTTLAALVLLAGCGGDDPASPQAGRLSGPEAQQWTVQVLEMINGVVLDVPSVAAGDFIPAKAAKAEGDPVWDEVQQAWTFDAVIDLSEGDPPTVTLVLELHVWVQFRGPDGPLPAALGATEVEYRYAEAMAMQGVSDEGTVDLDFAARTVLLVAYVEGGYAVGGTGSATVDAVQSGGGVSETLDFAMGWGLDLSLPLGGCPGGSAWVEADPYRLGALYDGQGGVAWSLGAPGYSAAGTDTLACGASF